MSDVARGPSVSYKTLKMMHTYSSNFSACFFTHIHTHIYHATFPSQAALCSADTRKIRICLDRSKRI